MPEMEKKYLKYTLEELIEDKQFIAWVMKGYQKEQWIPFIENHREIGAKAKKAREIILLLKDTYQILEEDEVLKMWQNIDQFDQLHKKKLRTIKFRKTLSWAASILIIFSIGTFSLYFLNNQDSYQFVSSDISIDQNESRLILPDGERISLEKEESTLALNNNELIINNENTIDLSGKVSGNKEEIQMNEVIVPYGKRSELLLADGTKVWLNAGSRLAFPSEFTQKTREVFLEGEACFKVAKNKEQPFIVSANKLDITVIGTLFNVAAYPGDESIETILVEGSVAVSKKAAFGISKNEVVLKPFQKASFNKEKKELVVSNEPHAEVYIAWTEGWFEFSKQSLQSIFTKIERYYNVEVIIPKSFPSKEKISGKLDLKDSLEDVMKALADVAQIEYRIGENKICIDKKLNKMPVR